jgi:hypothetical protein
LAIHYINCNCPIARRLFLCIARKVTGSNEQTFIGTPLHCPSKISNFPSTDSPATTLTLEDNPKTEDSINSGNPGSVNSPIAGSTRDFDLHKACFSQYALDLTLES